MYFRLFKNILKYVGFWFLVHNVSVVLYKQICLPYGKFYLDGLIYSIFLTSTFECRLLFDICNNSHLNFLHFGSLMSITLYEMFDKLKTTQTENIQHT